MIKTKEQILLEAERSWQQLQSLLHPDLLAAPRLDWRRVHPCFIRYLYQEVRDVPWLNRLALTLAVLTDHTRLAKLTIGKNIYNLHARFRTLFPAFGFTSFEQWNPIKHFPSYFEDEEMSDDSATRQFFLRTYNSASRHVAAYLRSLPEREQSQYQQWALPVLPADLHRSLSRETVVREQQRRKRKDETDAVTPHFARIRGEAHLRFNQMKRLREKCREAVTLVQAKQASLPVCFSYEEPRMNQRLHFRLWDRYSFFVHHREGYSKRSRSCYRRKVEGFEPSKNHFFLEFLGAENLSTGKRDLPIVC